jgi:ABC-type transport system involved in multi-copper enzyme maturation permease subunit
MKILAIIIDTLRQTISKGTLLFFFGMSTITILVLSFAFSHVTVDGVTTISFFGNVVSKEAGPKFLELFQAGLITFGFFGLLLFGVFATAGILPEVMTRGTIDLYISKPIGRPFILLGKYLGALSAIALNVLYGIGGLWIMFGLTTGIWSIPFLYTFVILTFSYAVVYCFITLLAIIIRSSGFVIMVSFLYIFVFDSILYNRQHLLYGFIENSIVRNIIDGFYYALPQISDLQANTLRLVAGGSMTPAPIYYSAASGVAALILAIIIFNRKDF